MKKIVGIINPFLNNHSFYIYENGKEIDKIDISLSNINTVFDLVDRYNINQIDLAGPKAYTSGIKNLLQETNVSSYNKMLNISLI